MKKRTIVLLVMLIVNVLYFPMVLSQNENSEYIYLKLNKEFGFRGQKFRVFYNSSFINIQLIIINPSGIMIYNQTVYPNGSKLIPILSNSYYGTYKIRGIKDKLITETWFSVISNNNFSSVSMPYSRIHNNMNITFYGNWTITIKDLSDSFMLMDFSSFRELNNLYEMDIKVIKNDNFFLVRAIRGSNMYDLSFMFYHRGIKWTWNGTIDQPRTFEIKLPVSKINKLKDELVNGNLIHSIKDLRKSGISFLYKYGILYIQVETNFYIDPIIFQSNFESGGIDSDNWTGNVTLGTAYAEVNGESARTGNYGLLVTIVVRPDLFYVWKDVPNEETPYMSVDFRYNTSIGGGANYIRGIMLYSHHTGDLAYLLIGPMPNAFLSVRFRNNTAYTSVTNASWSLNPIEWHNIEYNINPSSADNVYDGNITVWVNGTKALFVNNIDTDHIRDTDEVRLGIIQWGSNKPTDYWFDNFIYSDDRIGYPPISIIIHDGLSSNETQVDDLESFELNITISMNPSTYNFSRNILIINSELLAINITYLNGTGFSELNDPSDYISLNVGSCSKTDISITSLNLTYVLFIRKTITKESWFNITSFTNETGGFNASDLFQDVFNLTIRKPTSSPDHLYGAGFNSSNAFTELYWKHDGVLTDDYEIQNSTDKISWDLLGTQSIPFYNDTSVENGTKRYYKIRARRSTGVGYKNSTFSDINFEMVNFTKAVGFGIEYRYPASTFIMIIFLFSLGLFIIWMVKKK